jgi:protein-S-isoprenylcysteine O-methyltransferase Ste14
MTGIETLIRTAAILLGAVVLVLPALSVVRLSRRRRAGRASGSVASRSWSGALLALLGFVTVGVLLWVPLPLRIRPEVGLALSTLGALVYFPGTALYLWAFVRLDEQFGVSSVLGAGLYRDHRLVTGGPFAYVRHPMYAGVLLAALGALLIFRTWAMALFAPTSLVVLARAEREEALLAEEFGQAWQAYAARVPKWFLRL